MMDENISELNPRSYQTEIMEQAKSENLIVCLPTGSGKTFIATMLIKELSPAVLPKLDNGGKRTVILVKTVELARQHDESLSKHLALKIKVHAGSSKIKLQDRARWKAEFENNQVLIFTAQIFLNLLNHDLFSLHQVNLLIFDECHHATGSDPYASIMEKYDSCRHCPRILGLTASITGQKIEPDKLETAANALEKIYHARIETGSDREEITRNSTAVKVVNQRCQDYKTTVSQKEKIVQAIFNAIECLFAELDRYLKTKKEPVKFENASSETTDQSNPIQFQCRTLDQLKSHLDNIIHMGYDLGLYGFSVGVKSLRDYLKSKNMPIINQIEKDLYNKIIMEIDILIDNRLQNLPDNPEILYSGKVVELEKRIRQNNTGQCIIFVERVHTAAFLCQILQHKKLKVQYLAGSKAYIDGISVSSKYQRQVVREFRQKDLNILISTAIIEEGLDVPGCNLVIRFNKPQNFSSYMQSKGRARARLGDAQFILLRDEPNVNIFAENREEYDNYEIMEKKLKRNFRSVSNADQSSQDDFDPNRSYRLENGVKIDAIRAIQIIYQYCAVLGNGQILSPRFCYFITDCNLYKCILSMPLNCPIQENINCTNKNKKIAKQECCLKMIELLYKQGELDRYYLPIRPEKCSTDDSSDNDEETEQIIEQKKTSVEPIDKQTAYFFHEYDSLSTGYHLYKIHMPNNDGLGFIVPYSQIKLPRFNLYGRDSQSEVQVIYVKPVDLKECKIQLAQFCQYIFEEVFTGMNKNSDVNLKFNFESSTFKLLPCLLTKSGDIDYQRMASICKRKNRSIQDPSELNDDELYCITSLEGKQFFMNISDPTLSKRVDEKWPHKRALETIETYADHFEYKYPPIRIQRGRPMAFVKDFRRPRINYLKDSSAKTDKELKTDPRYFPMEMLHYAPLNQSDLQLIYKLPSLLLRIAQLSYIEQLKHILATIIPTFELDPDDEIPVVTFKDCLIRIFSLNSSAALPLASLNYNQLLDNKDQFYLSSDLLFQSITRRSADEYSDMENLEILGDCFLKLAMSMSLYHQYPSENAGKLTSKKDKQVSNKNLYGLAKKQKLYNYINAVKSVYEGKDANWIPPGYTIAGGDSKRYIEQEIKKKGFADMIEALIGAFLVSTDYITTIKFMEWVGLDVIPTVDQSQTIKTPSILSNATDDVTARIAEFFISHAFNEIEDEIKYIFKNKAYLIAAFTHASYCNNKLTQCYERLEYLGDAVLDFLIIRCVFVEYYKYVTPSHVTSIRQDLANNGRLAYILVSRDLHKRILHESPYLFDQISVYVGNETSPRKNQQLEDRSSKDIDQWADSTAPKALADVFEALVGAIFLDSGYSLNAVWKIIEPLFRQYIAESVKNPNLNPIRSFYEKGGKLEKKLKEEKEDYFTCVAKLPDESEVTGRGKNKKMAKYDACRQAMDLFKKPRHS